MFKRLEKIKNHKTLIQKLEQKLKGIPDLNLYKDI